MGHKKNLILKGRIIQEYGSQTIFADQVGIPENKISRIVNGHDRVKPEQAQAIADALGVKVEELFDS